MPYPLAACRNRMMETPATVPLISEVVDWNDRVTTNGGSVSTPTLNAVNLWYIAVKAESGLEGAIKYCLLLCGNDLPAALTPIIFDYTTNDPAGNTGFVSGDYAESSGLTGDGTNYLDVGADPGTFGMSDDSAHGAVYVDNSNNSATWLMGSASSGTELFRFTARLSGANYLDCWSDGANGRISVAETQSGFFIGTKPAASSHKIYRGNTSSGFSEVASDTNAEGTVSGDYPMFLMATNEAGSGTAPTTNPVRFFSVGTGLSLAQGTALYNATQTLQQTLGRAL